MTTIKPLYLRNDGRIKQAVVGDIIDSRLLSVPEGVTAYGSETINFGIAPGSTEASVVVTGLSDISSRAEIVAWLSADDSTGDHTAFDHMYAAGLISFTCGTITPGVGFVIYGRSLENMIGSFKVRYAWVVPGTPTPFARNADWPVQTANVNGVQKFTGLLAVFDHPSNFVALQASGNYTVDWGDGGGSFNVNAGVQAERNISYASVPGTIVGTSKAVTVTFTDAGDLVNLTAHGYQNGQRVCFSIITGTTGISVDTAYFIVGRTANTFQVSATLGGSALALTTNGSGSVYFPEYKVAVVTVTMQSGQNLTSFSLQKKHTQAGIPNYATPWLDVAINGSLLTTLEISNATPTTLLRNLTIVSLGENAIANFSNMFYKCLQLQALSLNTSSGTNFSGMFFNCSLMQEVSLFDTSIGTNFSSMFEACYSMSAVPLFDTSAGLNFSSMFNSCNALKTIPLFDTTIGTDFSSMFSGCSSLQSIPLLNTTSGTNFSSMFSGCSSLQSIPLLNTAAGLNFRSMFSECEALQAVPLLNTASGTTFISMFFNCFNLSSARLAGTAESIDYSSCRLSATALDDIYAGLATVVGKTITVTGNYGTTGDNPTIATGKGWTVS